VTSHNNTVVGHCGPWPPLVLEIYFINILRHYMANHSRLFMLEKLAPAITDILESHLFFALTLWEFSKTKFSNFYSQGYGTYSFKRLSFYFGLYHNTAGRFSSSFIWSCLAWPFVVFWLQPFWWRESKWGFKIVSHTDAVLLLIPSFVGVLVCGMLTIKCVKVN